MAGACASGRLPRSLGAVEVEPAQRSTRPRTQTRQCRRPQQRLRSSASSAQLAPIGPVVASAWRAPSAEGRLPGPAKLSASVVIVEDVAQSAGEGFRLAGVSVLAAHEVTVMAGEDRRLLTKPFGGGHRRASGDGARGLLAHGDPA